GLAFDGVDDRLTLTNTGVTSGTLANFLGLNGDFTVMAWVRADNWSGSRPVLASHGSGADQDLFLGIQDGAPLLDVGSNQISGGSLPTNEWIHLAWRYRT